MVAETGRHDIICVRNATSIRRFARAVSNAAIEDVGGFDAGGRDHSSVISTIFSQACTFGWHMCRTLTTL